MFNQDKKKLLSGSLKWTNTQKAGHNLTFLFETTASADIAHTWYCLAHRPPKYIISHLGIPGRPRIPATADNKISTSGSIRRIASLCRACFILFLGYTRPKVHNSQSTRTSLLLLGIYISIQELLSTSTPLPLTLLLSTLLFTINTHSLSMLIGLRLWTTFQHTHGYTLLVALYLHLGSVSAFCLLITYQSLVVVSLESSKHC